MRCSLALLFPPTAIDFDSQNTAFELFNACLKSLSGLTYQVIEAAGHHFSSQQIYRPFGTGTALYTDAHIGSR